MEEVKSLEDTWKPKTALGKKVKAREITDIDQILDCGIKILEPEIVDFLLPNLVVELVETGQSKGKFGGGKSSIWRQTQKVTKEGKKIKFTTYAIVGNKDGYIGLGTGSAEETVPAREKAMKTAKMNIIKVRRGCGSWACGCCESHSIPFKIEGKVSSAKIVLMGAPKGTGLTAQKQCQQMLRIAGIKDIYSKTYGQTKTRMNLIKACFEALRKLVHVKVQPEFAKSVGMIEGRMK